MKLSTYGFMRKISKFITNKRPIIKSMIAVGDSMIDITCNVNKETLEKYGLRWGQTLLASEKNIGLFDEFEKNPSVKYSAGGSIQNSLRVLSWILNMDPINEIKITMLSAIGDDSYKDIILKRLQEDGVEPLFEIIPGKTTSRCAVAVYENERCLLSNIEASKLLSNKFIKENEEKILANDALFLEGYFIPSKFELCKNLADKFSEMDKTVIMTIGANFVIENFYDKLIELCNHADMIFCNIEEAESLAKHQSKDYDKVFEIIHKKLKERHRTLIVTAGKNGVYCSEYNYTKGHLDFSEHIFPDSIPKEEISDFNGAGDTFLGGFVAQYLMGGSLNSCSKTGNKASGVVIRNIGCTFDKDLVFDFRELE